MSFDDAPIHPGSRSLLGLQFHTGGTEAMHNLIRKTLHARQKAFIAHLNLHAVCLGLKHPWFRDFINRSQFVYCDGEALCWAAKILGEPVPPKTGLTRWIWDLAGLCEKEGARLFLLGGNPGVAEEAALKLKRRYPGLKMAGTHDGYFSREGAENREVIEMLNAAQPDIVVVAFGMPFQEKWIAENWPYFVRGIFVPGGGVLDYTAGRNAAAPAWIVHGHLEWLYRVWKEPRRLAGRYAAEIPYFLWVVLKEKLKRSRPNGSLIVSQSLTLHRSQKEPRESSSDKV